MNVIKKNNVMKWNYKNIEVTIDEDDGIFYFEIEGKQYKEESLAKAFNIISEKRSEYYNITKRDLDNLYAKLNSREKDFVSAMIEELDRHDCNPYCELGITDEFEFNIQKGK